MENQITIREANTEDDVALFWEQLHTYYNRDMFPDPNAEERDYFLGDEYRSTMQEIHARPKDRCYYLFFQRNRQNIGFALPVIYTSEDGKCFIMEYCVYPEYRGNGTGKECAKVLLNWAEENGFKKYIGEESLTEDNQKQLQQAIKDGKITFFVAKRGYRAVGMCSVTKCYSTFSCSDTGVYEDFYIEPAFRGKGIARKLVQAAQAWCKDNGISSLTVCCAPCDEKMYQALGFDIALGTTFAHIE